MTDASRPGPSAAPSPAPPDAGKLSLPPLIALSLGYFLVMLDVTVVNVAVPNIRESLGTSSSVLQWIVDGYSVFFAGLLLLGGGLGDRLGHRRMFLTGLGIFTGASVLCAVAGSGGELVAGRLLQGAGAGFLVPCSFALLQVAYPDRVQRAKAVGVWGLVSAVAFGAGPAIGGLLVSGLDWRAVFWANLPVAALAFALTLRYVPTVARKANVRRMDPLGQVLGVVGLVAIAAALNEAGTLGWSSGLVITAFVVGAAALAAFAAVEWRLEARMPDRPDARAPVLPLSLFSRPRFSATVTVGLLLSMGYYGLLFLVAIYFQEQRGFDALTTGLALLPSVMMGFVAAPLSSRLAARYGPYVPMAAALTLGCVGFLGWLTAGPDTPYVVLLFALMATGLATPMTVVASTVAIMDTTTTAQAGIGSAVFNVSRQIGSAVGVALFGTIAATSADWVAGFKVAAVIASVAFLVAALLAVYARRTTAPDLIDA